MDAIVELTKIDYVPIFISIFVILFGIKAVTGLVEWIITKLGLETKWMRKKREEHELLLQTSKNLVELQERHKIDTDNSIKHDEKIEKELSLFMDEMRKEVRHFTENRVHDRQQSFEIQKELTDSMKVLADTNAVKEEQINSLINAQKEVLADRINSKYKYYISINGIPEDEVDEFTSLHFAYKCVGGNHMGDAKYEYCMNHLPVIPVETKLKVKTNNYNG